MARKALIIAPLALLLMSNRGCETIDHAANLSAARQIEAIASAKIALPNLDPSCTAKVGRVRPSLSEARVITLRRVDMVADARDQQSEDCAAWWAAYKAAIEQGGEGRR